MPSDPIQHLRGLMAKATPGYATKRTSMPGEVLLEIGDPFNRPSSSRSVQLPERDAALIVAAINALPSLLAVAEAARDVCANMVINDDGDMTVEGLSPDRLSEALAKLDEVKPS